jgi:hypothetical protein
MKRSAFLPAFCLDVAMRKMALSLVIVAALVGPAVAYSGHWLVVEAVDSQTCYRMTEIPDGNNWRQLGEFNTFRQAGQWIWEHRSGLCQNSPVFS